MTATLAPASPDVLYPVLKPVSAYTECVQCYRLGRVEWLPDGTVRALHHGQFANHICVIRLPRTVMGMSQTGSALLLLR
jgi:hypothetical protein